MNIRLYNAYILNGNFDISFGEIHISEGKIVYIGNSKSTSKKWDRNIDMHNAVVMHGFSNCHTHSPMTLLRSYCDDQPLKVWLEKYIFPIENKMTEEDCYYGTRLATMEYLSSGITAIADMYFFQEHVIQACIDSQIKVVGIGTAMDIDGKTDEKLEYLEQKYVKYNSYSPLCSYKLGFHAQYTASDNLIKGIAELSKKYKAEVCTHLSETASEVESCISEFGMTPAQYLINHGIFDYGGNAYHCVHLDKKDIELLNQKNVSIVTNPSSNLKLASGIADIDSFLKEGINVAIGTDGAASNNALDMFREIYLAAVLSKVVNNDASAVSAKKVLEMATLNGAKALRNSSGVLEVGSDADITAISLEQPNMQPINNIVNNIVCSASSKNIVLTMVKGKILYENGKYDIGISPEEVYQKCNNSIKRLKSQI